MNNTIHEIIEKVDGYEMTDFIYLKDFGKKSNKNLITLTSEYQNKSIVSYFDDTDNRLIDLLDFKINFGDLKNKELNLIFKYKVSHYNNISEEVALKEIILPKLLNFIYTADATVIEKDLTLIIGNPIKPLAVLNNLTLTKGLMNFDNHMSIDNQVFNGLPHNVTLIVSLTMDNKNRTQIEDVFNIGV